MDKAFDTLLQTIVDAESASLNSNNEAFRYDCICCGEEVYLAAQDSLSMATHFRHRSGNNDKECDLYLGQYGIIHAAKKNRNKRERVDFYYNDSTKCFYISLYFSDEEISQYESEETKIEIRRDRYAQPFYSLPINHSFFSPETQEKIVLDVFAESYFISNTISGMKREYRIFNERSPSFFKVLNSESDIDGFNAKLIRSKSIYTGVRYFVVWPGRNTAQIKLKNISDVSIEKEFDFKTFGGVTVWGIVVSFNGKNPDLDRILNDWGYNLDTSENVLLLWPPAFEKDEKLFVTSSRLFFHSSFRFQGRGNINTTETNFVELSNNLTMVSYQEPIHILKKNAELEIYREPLITPLLVKEIVQLKTNRFLVPKGNKYYLFSEYGTENLSEGQKVFLTSSTVVAEYAGNGLERIICFFEHSLPDVEEKFHEILSNYWVNKDYHCVKKEGFPQTIIDYLEECENNNRINAAVEKLIEGEGK